MERPARPAEPGVARPGPALGGRGGTPAYPSGRARRAREFLRRFWDPGAAVERHAALRLPPGISLRPRGDAVGEIAAASAAAAAMARGAPQDFVPSLSPPPPVLAPAGASPPAPGDLDRLAEAPGWEVSIRYGEEANRLRRAAPGFCIRCPELSSPLGSAARLATEEVVLAAMVERPRTLHRLLEGLTERTLGLLRGFRERAGPLFSGLHWPPLWMPPEFGVSLADDCAGLISPRHWEEFELPYISRISGEMGGLFVHCCGRLDTALEGFPKIPRLRGVELALLPAQAAEAVEAFDGLCPIHPVPAVGAGAAASPEELNAELVRKARPGTRLALTNVGSL